MKQILKETAGKNKNPNSLKGSWWVLNLVMTVGGILMGTGVADCVLAMNHLDLDQAARGLTIFSAGLTIAVLVDNTKTQKATEQIQQETHLQLKAIEKHLEALCNSQQLTEQQLQEIKNHITASNKLAQE